MADLNEPKKETVRITLPPRTPTVPVEIETARINLPTRPPTPPAGARPPGDNPPPPASGVVRPPPLVAPKPLPPAGGAPPARPPTPPPGFKPPTPPPSTGGKSPALPPAPPPASPKPISPPANPLAGRSGVLPGPRKETARIADSPMKATVKLGVQRASVPSAPFLRTAPPPGVANPLPQVLVEAVPTQLCWALLGISALTLLIQLWTYFS